MEALPDTLVDLVLHTASVGFPAARVTFNAVCRRFRHTVNHSPLFFGTLHLDCSAVAASLHSNAPAVREHLMAYAKAKAGACHSVKLKMSQGLQAAVLHDLLLHLASPTVTNLSFRVDHWVGQALGSAVPGTFSLSPWARLLEACFPNLQLLDIAGPPSRRAEGDLVVRHFYFADLESLALLSALRTLTLGKRCMLSKASLTGGLWELTQLRRLEVQCPLSRGPVIHDSISKLTSLQELKVSRAYLGLLPPSTSGLTALTSVTLKGTTSLYSMGGEEGAPAVRTLQLLANLRRLVMIQPSWELHLSQLFSISSLQELSITEWDNRPRDLHLHSFLPELPAGTWPHLTSLEMARGEYSDPDIRWPFLGPSWGQHLTALRRLYLRLKPWTNRQEEMDAPLPPQLSLLTSLQELEVRGCHMRSLPAMPPASLTKLVVHHLRTLQEIEDAHLPNLQELDLSFGLMPAPPQVEGATELRRLSLAGCPNLDLCLADAHTLAALPALTWLALGRRAIGGASQPWGQASLEGLIHLARLRPDLQLNLVASRMPWLYSGWGIDDFFDEEPYDDDDDGPFSSGDEDDDWSKGDSSSESEGSEGGGSEGKGAIDYEDAEGWPSGEGRQGRLKRRRSEEDFSSSENVGGNSMEDGDSDDDADGGSSGEGSQGRQTRARI